MHKTVAVILFLLAVSSTVLAANATAWPAKQANKWYASQPFLVGSNFIPSTAINELEMWQADTFDLPTIDRELGWAQNLGMNTMRVFLHNLLWQQDSAGFLRRMDQFLQVADNITFESWSFSWIQSGILSQSSANNATRGHRTTQAGYRLPGRRFSKMKPAGAVT